jgi:hypothetical protein
MMDDNILGNLKRNWFNIEPHLKNIELFVENKLVLEREGDEGRRKVADDFLELLVSEIPKINPEVVKTKTGYGLFLNYSSILNEKFEILFYEFEDNNNDLGYWAEKQQRMYINILNQQEFMHILKTQSYSRLFNIYYSTIFHELIHRFDHMRYSGSHKPADSDSYMNTYEEFNAFYQQYARSIDKIVNKMKTVDDFYKRFGVGAGNLISEFWNTMPKEMKDDIKSSKHWSNKWNKRIYQLYYEKLKKFNKELKDA